MQTEFDIIVVGGGHSGCEAASAAARLGSRVLLISMDLEKLAAMSCNPAVGGVAKGQIVREIDALGGRMGVITDRSTIQFRMLGRSKGAAMWSPRAQCDKALFSQLWRRELENTPGLFMWQDSVVDLIVDEIVPRGTVRCRTGADSGSPSKPATDGVSGPIVPRGTVRCHTGTESVEFSGQEADRVFRPNCSTWNNLQSTLEADELYNGKMAVSNAVAVDVATDNKVVTGVRTALGVEFRAKAVILTVGTFLNGRIHVGRSQTEGGRLGDRASNGLTERLIELGFEAGRMKTGTPARIDGRTIDFSKLERQEGDMNPSKFSFSPETQPVSKQLPCYIANTSAEVHEILQRGFADSPLFNGTIQGVGPRYCPSIEDKLRTFADKNSHQLFLEPEGVATNEWYLNGFSSSLPWAVQAEALQHIAGLENAHILKPGYAIEYDYFPPTQLHHTLATKLIPNLYFAGQINGTTGYEEAAAQGLMAGINAHVATATAKQRETQPNPEAIGTAQISSENYSTHEAIVPRGTILSEAGETDKEEGATSNIRQRNSHCGTISEDGKIVTSKLFHVEQFGSETPTASSRDNLTEAAPVRHRTHVEQLLDDFCTVPKDSRPSDDPHCLAVGVPTVEHFVLKRDEAYIGVLIDDLVTKGVDEPYRMFTSRAEYRILLRQDNADMRLTPIGRKIGLVDDRKWATFEQKKSNVESLRCFVHGLSVDPCDLQSYLFLRNSAPLTQKRKLSFILSRSEISLGDPELWAAVPSVADFVAEHSITAAEIEQVEIEIKYRGYIERERLIAEKLHRLEEVAIPTGFDFGALGSLTMEARQKLTRIRPATIGQASRIPGVSPADINVLLVYFGR